MNDFEEICKLRHLYRAAIKCSQGTMWKAGTALYRWDALRQSARTRRGLKHGTYRMQHYQHFTIAHPKVRRITATRVRDRHPQRSICDRVLYARATADFIPDNGACQVGRGVDYQLERVRHALRSYWLQQRRQRAKEMGCRPEDVPPFHAEGWVYKGDVRRYFPSTLHANARAVVDKCTTDTRLRALLYCVVESFGEDWWYALAQRAGITGQAAKSTARAITDARMELRMLPIRPADKRQSIRSKCLGHIAWACKAAAPEMRQKLLDVARDPDAPVRGIGLGSQISQILQLAQLDGVDHWATDALRPHYYGRYMDDFLILDADRGKAAEGAANITAMLEQLGLKLNPKSQLIPLREGFVFLKWHFTLTDTGRVVMRAAPGVAKNEKRRLRRMAAKVQEGTATAESVLAHYQGFRAHIARGDTAAMVAALDKYTHGLLAGKGVNHEHCCTAEPAGSQRGSPPFAAGSPAAETPGPAGLCSHDGGRGAAGRGAGRDAGRRAGGGAGR